MNNPLCAEVINYTSLSGPAGARLSASYSSEPLSTVISFITLMISFSGRIGSRLCVGLDNNLTTFAGFVTSLAFSPAAVVRWHVAESIGAGSWSSRFGRGHRWLVFVEEGCTVCLAVIAALLSKSQRGGIESIVKITNISVL